jgi:hypothetical protein
LTPSKLVLHRHEMLGDDVQLRVRHQVMDVGERGRPPSSRSGSCRDRRRAEPRLKAVLEGGAGHGLGVRIGLADGEVRIRPGSPWNTIFSCS